MTISAFFDLFFQRPSSVLYVVYCLAVILFATKLLGMLARKIGLPQVVGMVFAGLLIGPAIFSRIPALEPFHGILDPDPESMDILETFSQIGVILLLFSSGLETNFKELKRSGLPATLVAVAGVLVPTGLGFCAAMFFMPHGWADIGTHDAVLNALFVGIILAATSVGITVETLRELGRLNTRVGTTILSAAIIDDVLGIVVLSIVTGLKGGSVPVWLTILKTVLFFAFAIGLGLGARALFKWMEKKWPHTRRTGIFSLAMCFLYAFAAETFFGVAAITGAYMAGLMLSGLSDTGYVNKKVVASGYLIFSPIFFAFIGISADFSQFEPVDLLFGLVFVAVGVIGKVVGCGGAAKACRYKWKDSARIGCGMIARGEVALAVYHTGSALIWKSAEGALIGVDPMVATIMLIVLSSILCPIFLKLLFRHVGYEEDAEGQPATAALPFPLHEGGIHGHEATVSDLRHTRAPLDEPPDENSTELPPTPPKRE